MTLEIQHLILLNAPAVDPDFDKHRRHLLHSASREELLKFKLELTETLGILELHSRPDNSVTYWYAEKLARLLALVDETITKRTKKWR